jgi:uncharacterized protein (DUF433 family)
MEPSLDWKDCPLVSIEPDVMHGAPVFGGTRVPVKNAIENHFAYREMDGLSDEDAVKGTLDSFRTILGAEAPRTVLAYEASHKHQLRP